MSMIRIVRQHNGDQNAARQAAERAAEQMAERYDIRYRWEGDSIRFSRTGVDGVMHINDQAIEIQAHLNFLLAMLKGAIENEIEKELDRYFS